MENKAHLGEIHQNFVEWTKHLDFCKDEISSWQNRLDEVAKQNNTSDILVNVEHFQNQFIRQREVIDTLKHDFKLADGALAQNAMDNPVASDRRFFDKPELLKDQYETFTKIYGELKSEFEKFLSKTL